MAPLTGLGEGYVRESGASAAASVASLLAAAAADAGFSRLISLAHLHDDMRTVLTADVNELERSYTPPTEATELRSEMLGFWKLLITSDDELAATGATGFGAAAHRSILGRYTVYTEKDDYEPRPTLQTVEVVSDHRVGRSVVGAIKGDFFVGKLATTGEFGVVEDHVKKEYDDEACDGSSLEPVRWSCVYLDETLRVIRTDSGALLVFEKVDGSLVNSEIERLVDLPVAQLAIEEEDEDDDRPLWQRRLDEENARENRFGPPAESSIP